MKPVSELGFKPQSHVFVVGETKVDDDGVLAFLEHIGAPDWHSDAHNDSDYLAEIMGRLCYKSFGVGLNPNITRVREGNREYLGNVIKQEHGSVFEHAVANFIFTDVSRILTHELVRHRVGDAFSQESQRFVRLDDFQMYIPDLTPALEQLYDHHTKGGSQNAMAKERWIALHSQKFLTGVEHIAEVTKGQLADLIGQMQLDADGVPFHVKKLLTSAFRRFIPGGVNTNIGFSANHRTLRFLIQQRTSPGAEVEIVELFQQVAEICYRRWPATYQDMYTEPHDDGIHTWFKFENHKI